MISKKFHSFLLVNKIFKTLKIDFFFTKINSRPVAGSLFLKLILKNILFNKLKSLDLLAY